jgi:formylglycine-generating enzyme required for sulfatase activity
MSADGGSKKITSLLVVVLVVLMPVAFFVGFFVGKNFVNADLPGFKLQPGEAKQVQIYTDYGTYNNCNGFGETDFNMEKTRNKTVSYTISSTGNITLNAAAVTSKVELTIGRNSGEVLSDSAKISVPVPQGRAVRIDILWTEDVGTGNILDSNDQVVGYYQVPTNLSYEIRQNDIPCQVVQQSSLTSALNPPSFTAGNFVNVSFSGGKSRGKRLSARQDPIDAAFNFSGNNNDWSAYTENFDGVNMALVPAGCMQMGSTEDQLNYIASLGLGDPDTFWDELNGTVECVDEPFWIDQYEVTNDQFAGFGGTANRESFRSDPGSPRENITWYEAEAYCESRGGALPTELQWEFAARGPDALIFPWGNEFDDTKVAYSGNESRTVDGYVYADGASWVGALNMSGNVWEWTASLYGLFPDSELEGSSEFRVIRGGSIYIEDSVHAENRAGSFPDDSNSLRGFRCARPIS